MNKQFTATRMAARACFKGKHTGVLLCYSDVGLCKAIVFNKETKELLANGGWEETAEEAFVSLMEVLTILKRASGK